MRSIWKLLVWNELAARGHLLGMEVLLKLSVERCGRIVGVLCSVLFVFGSMPRWNAPYLFMYLFRVRQMQRGLIVFSPHDFGFRVFTKFLIHAFVTLDMHYLDHWKSTRDRRCCQHTSATLLHNFRAVVPLGPYDIHSQAPLARSFLKQFVGPSPICYSDSVVIGLASCTGRITESKIEFRPCQPFSLHW